MIMEILFMSLNLLVFCTGNFEKPCASQAVTENEEAIKRNHLLYKTN